MKLYRKMDPDTDDSPVVGSGRNMLGVRPKDPANPKLRADVSAVTDADGVKPGEGLSVFTSPGAISPHVGGRLYSIDTDDLPAELTIAQRGKNPAHYHIEPDREMALGELQQLLESTRDLWQQEP